MDDVFQVSKFKSSKAKLNLGNQSVNISEQLSYYKIFTVESCCLIR